jgi:hypothetical protein
MDRTNVETVIVAGKVRKWKGKLLGVDLPKFAPAARELARLRLQGGRHTAGPVSARNKAGSIQENGCGQLLLPAAW